MATLKVGTASTLTDKILMSEVFATQVALENPLEVAGMMGPGKNFVVRVLNKELSKGGDEVTFHRRNKLTGAGHDEGDPREGYEQAINFDDDSVTVSEKSFTARVKSEGTIDDQRTPYDMVEETMEALQVQVAEWKAWLVITMLAGKVGTNVEILPTDFSGWAGNTLTDVDSNHLLYAGDATAKANLDATDTFTMEDLITFKNVARTLTYKIPTLRIRGKDYHLVGIHPDVWRDLQLQSTGQSWFDVEKAMLQGGADPMTNGIITGAVAIRNGCIIHVIDQLPIFEDYGAGSNVRASRVLFMGPQAAVYAMGNKTQKQEWAFKKKKFEYDSETGICATTMAGCNAVIFNSERGSMLAMDVATAAAA